MIKLFLVVQSSKMYLIFHFISVFCQVVLGMVPIPMFNIVYYKTLAAAD